MAGVKTETEGINQGGRNLPPVTANAFESKEAVRWIFAHPEKVR